MRKDSIISCAGIISIILGICLNSTVLFALGVAVFLVGVFLFIKIERKNDEFWLEDSDYDSDDEYWLEDSDFVDLESDDSDENEN